MTKGLVRTGLDYARVWTVRFVGVWIFQICDTSWWSVGTFLGILVQCGNQTGSVELTSITGVAVETSNWVD